MKPSAELSKAQISFVRCYPGGKSLAAEERGKRKSWSHVFRENQIAFRCTIIGYLGLNVLGGTKVMQKNGKNIRKIKGF